MAHRWLALLLLLICVATTRGAAKSDTPITCEAGLCTAGTRTSVTCNFNEDISVLRHAFSVRVYPLNASRDDIGRTVLACKWPESRTKPECIVENGFSFNYIVTDRLTLEVPDATEEVAGQYVCALVPLDHRTVKMCTLQVKVPGNETRKKDSRGQELKINQADAQTTTEETVSPKSSSPTRTDNSQGGYADFSRVNFGLNVVILVLFVVVGIVVAVVLIRKRKRDSVCGLTEEAVMSAEDPAGTGTTMRQDSCSESSEGCGTSYPMLGNRSNGLNDVIVA